MGKQYIKGFSGLRYWPVSKNDDTGYTTGEMEAIPGAQSATMDRSTDIIRSLRTTRSGIRALTLRARRWRSRSSSWACR